MDTLIIISVRFASPAVNITANSSQTQPPASQTGIYFTVNIRKRVFKAQIDCVSNLILLFHTVFFLQLSQRAAVE